MAGEKSGPGHTPHGAAKGQRAGFTWQTRHGVMAVPFTALIERRGYSPDTVDRMLTMLRRFDATTSGRVARTLPLPDGAALTDETGAAAAETETPPETETETTRETRPETRHRDWGTEAREWPREEPPGEPRGPVSHRATERHA
jgi:hypothetical protein